ncbi:MAG: hypothetical protein IJ400_01525 [Clostridia bacterium]|nr:hypothetical protein [Clostridia bacterium]
MKYTIDYVSALDESLLFGLSFLLNHIRTGLLKYFYENKCTTINEIRIKAENTISLITNTGSKITDIFVSKSELEQIITDLCGGSIYAHIDEIKQGYISVGMGIRAGVCGKAIFNGDEITSITNFTSVNLRFPHLIKDAGLYLYRNMQIMNFKGSILLFSAPGVGKTTILRDFCHKLSQNNSSIRFALIDTREEISTCFKENLRGDIYLSYPKGVAIELATKSMTPNLIICDEISSQEEANAILKASHGGVSLVSTTHAGSFEELMSKEIIKNLINAGVFDLAIGVYRNEGEKRYTFSTHSLK